MAQVSVGLQALLAMLGALRAVASPVEPVDTALPSVKARCWKWQEAQAWLPLPDKRVS